MAVSISTAMQNALDTDLGAHLAGMLTFSLGSGTYGFWDGPGTINYGSLDYHAAGSLFDIPSIDTGADGSVSELVLGLSASPDKGLDSDVLASLDEEDWHLRPMTLALAVLNPADHTDIIGSAVLFRGRIEATKYTYGVDADRIEAQCASVSMDLGRSGGLYRNAAVQARFDSSDTGLVGVGTIGKPLLASLKWGQAA